MASAVLLSSLATGVEFQPVPSGVGLASSRPVFVYLRTTTTQVQVYSDAGLTVPVSQPVTTGSDGTPGAIPGYIAGGVSIDFVDQTSGKRTQAEALVAADVIGTDGKIGGRGSVGLSAFPSVKDFGATGTADDTTVIQAAIDATSASGGGFLVMPAGTYAHHGLVLKSNVILWGMGHNATILYLISGSNVPSVINHVSTNGTTDPNAENCGLYNLQINGNWAGQTVDGCHGIFLNHNPSSAQASPGDSFLFDPNYRLFNVLVWNCRGNGVDCATANINALLAEQLYVADCKTVGGRFGNDIFINNSAFGNCAQQGVAVIGNAALTNVRSFGSGSGSGGTAYGNFDLTNALFAVLNTCYAQDGQGPGFVFNNTQNCILNGCVAESNSQHAAGAVPGYDFWNSRGNQLLACLSSDRNSTPTQDNALRLRNASTGNTIELQHNPDPYVNNLIGSVFQQLDSDCYANDFRLQGKNSFVAPAYAATYTPNPFANRDISMTLTGALTVNAPVSALAGSDIWHPGMRMRFLLKQDGTGGRVVTWNAAWVTSSTFTPNTAAGKTNIYDFEYVGAAGWVQTGGITV